MIPPSTAESCFFLRCVSSQHHWKSRGTLQAAPVLINVLAKKTQNPKKGFANGFAAPISLKKYLNVFAFLGQPFEKIQTKLEKAERPADHKFQVFPLSHLLIKFLL